MTQGYFVIADAGGGAPVAQPAAAPTGTTAGKGAPGSSDVQPPPASGSPIDFMLPLLLIIGVMYFFMFAPQRKKDKERRQMLEQLRRGDKVVTIGGIFGEVASLSDDAVVLVVDSQKGTTLKMRRSAISSVLKDGEEAAEEKK